MTLVAILVDEKDREWVKEHLREPVSAPELHKQYRLRFHRPLACILTFDANTIPDAQKRTCLLVNYFRASERYMPVMQNRPRQPNVKHYAKH